MMRFYANPTAAIHGLVHLMLDDQHIAYLGGKGTRIALKKLSSTEYELVPDPQGTAQPRRKRGGYWGLYFPGQQWPATGRTPLTHVKSATGFILKPYESELIPIKTKMGRKKAVPVEDDTPIAPYHMHPTVEQLKRVLKQVNDLLAELPNVEVYVSDRRVRARVTTVIEL